MMYGSALYLIFYDYLAINRLDVTSRMCLSPFCLEKLVLFSGTVKNEW